MVSASSRQKSLQSAVTRVRPSARGGQSLDGQRLTEPEFASLFLLLLSAGGDTTRNLIGGATLSLLGRPAQ